MNLRDFPNLVKASFEVDDRMGVLRSPVLDHFLWLTHGMTTRRFAAAESDAFELTERVRRQLVPGGSRIFCCEQVHGSAVEVVDAAARSAETAPADARGTVCQLPGADGLIACDPLLPVAIRTADCVPLLVVDVRRRRVAAVHAGWRGALERIAEKAVAALARLGSAPADLVAWMGPAISRESYEVGPELADRFRAAFPDCEGIVADHHLDLVLLNACQLRSAGVPGAQIHAANCCTARHRELCFSYRIEPDRAGRMVTYAMVLPEKQDGGSLEF